MSQSRPTHSNDSIEPIPGWYGSEPDEGIQQEDPYSGFKELRETQPVNLTPDGGWRLTRYEDIQYLLRKASAGMRLTNGLIPGQEQEVHIGADIDPPQ